MLAHSFFIKLSSKLLVTRTGIKAWLSSISGLWFPWPIYMFFEMRFDLGTLDSGEWSLPFGLLFFTVYLCLFSTSYLLSYDRDITAMQVIASAIEEYQLTWNSDTLNSVVSLYISSLHNFSTALCQLKQILQNRWDVLQRAHMPCVLQNGTYAICENN